MSAAPKPKTAGRCGGQVQRDATLCVLHGVGNRNKRCTGPLDADGLCAVHAANAELVVTRDTLRRETATGAAARLRCPECQQVRPYSGEACPRCGAPAPVDGVHDDAPAGRL